MKAGWELKTLGEVASITNGGTPKSDVKQYWGGDIAWLTPKDMGKLKSKLASNTSRMITAEGLSKCSAKLIPENSVILSTRAPIGHLAINTVPMAFNQGCRGLVPNDNLSLKYLFHYLSANVDVMNELGTGTTFKELSAGALKSLPIPLPPLEEQKRIVSILDEAFEGLDRARENAEANLKSARELFESSLGAVFEHASDGWTRGTVGSMIHDGILEKPLDGNHGETHPKKSEFQSSGVPFIMASDLANGSVDQNNCYFISKSQAETLRKGFAKDGDVLISHKGTIGRTAVLRTDLDYVMLTPQVTYYRTADQNRLLPEFLYFYFHSATFLRVMRDLASAGSTRAYIGITKQHELPLLLPEITLQLELIDRFKSIEEIKNKAILSYKNKLQDISDLRQSLLQKAFAGELT